jgi:hypothetical protein
MASKWDDDDDVVRPAVQNPKKDLRGELDDWQAKVNAAAKTAKELAPDPPAKVSAKVSVNVERDAKPEPPPPPPKPSEREIEALERQAEASAADVAFRAQQGKPSKKVRLRVKVSGWYEGSVPAVDFCDGRPHFFPRAPTKALESAEHYLEYWRKPFIAHLRSLGFEVIENDL